MYRTEDFEEATAAHYGNEEPSGPRSVTRPAMLGRPEPAFARRNPLSGFARGAGSPDLTWNRAISVTKQGNGDPAQPGLDCKRYQT
jgi:hypothetical protein